jgi:multiple sugar transport system permease protein
MTNAGGPNNSSKTIVFYIYDNGFKFLNMGFASALAWALFIIIFSLTVVQLRLQNKWVEY